MSGRKVGAVEMAKAGESEVTSQNEEAIATGGLI
jgi:hypothetical protein